MKIQNYLFSMFIILLSLSSCDGDDDAVEGGAFTYTVSFVTDGGSTVEDKDVPHGDTATRPEGPSKEGHTFVGWYVDAELSQSFDFATKIVADVRLFAKWERNTYTVSFETSGGSTVEDQTVAYGDSATRPEDPSREGRTFAGWYGDAELLQAFDFASEIVVDVQLFAKWATVAHTVSFDTDGGSTVEERTVAHRDTATRPEDPIREGYSFVGWYGDAELLQAFDFAMEIDRDIQLYGKWERITYTVSFDTSGGSIVEDRVVSHGDSTTRPEDPFKEGHTFAGWYSDTEQTQVFDFAMEIEGDIQLYTKWERITYTVSFDTSGGSTVEERTVAHGDTATRPEDPIMEGYSFAGWYSDTELLQAFDFATEIEGDIQLHPKWKYLPETKTDLQNLLFTDNIAPSLIDTRLVVDMSFLFRNQTQIGDISDWDVSNVVSMRSMFEGASNFNQDLSGWDVSNVMDMSRMLRRASSFNQDISGWDVSKVFGMFAMFQEASSFNQDISGWDVSDVVDMSSMFQRASSFNQDISDWDVSKVGDMSRMFHGASSFNQDISSWDVSTVLSYHSMFEGADAMEEENKPNFY